MNLTLNWLRTECAIVILALVFCAFHLMVYSRNEYQNKRRWISWFGIYLNVINSAQEGIFSWAIWSCFLHSKRRSYLQAAEKVFLTPFSLPPVSHKEARLPVVRVLHPDYQEQIKFVNSIVLFFWSDTRFWRLFIYFSFMLRLGRMLLLRFLSLCGNCMPTRQHAYFKS